MTSVVRTAAVAWLITAVYYFYQYTLRSAPAVMMPQMAEGFGLTSMGVASLVGLFYYGYSPFSLVAGAAMDRLGARRVVPLGAAAVGVGSLLFAVGDSNIAAIGRILQGAGGVFGLIGAVYIATTSFPASRAATLIGATQMFGMAGGSAGQFVVGPAIAAGTPWRAFWAVMGVTGIAISILLHFFLPETKQPQRSDDWIRGTARALWAVFRRPQSILCGMISGLLFIPTTIFDMVWGVRYLQEARGIDYGTAVMRSAMVPLGWMIGCPMLGFVSDRIGRRKPVIIASALVLFCCLAWILYGRTGVLPPYVIGLVAGIASGAAMLPYTIIKEVNPPDLSGTATGVVNFLNFTLSALLGPVFASLLVSASAGVSPMALPHYQTAFEPLLYGVALAIVLTLLLKETGWAADPLVPIVASGDHHETRVGNRKIRAAAPQVSKP
jgi:MFS family permease